MRRLLAASLLLVCSHGPYAQEPAHLEDFAYALELMTEGKGAVYNLSLPDAVYSGATRADLGDLRVFNAAGEAVPHSLRVPAAARQTATSGHDLPLFPLYSDQPQDRSSLTLRIDQEGLGAHMDLRQGVGAGGPVLEGYLLDARQVGDPIRSLSPQWEAGGFLARVQVEASDDLEHWRRLVTDVVLADLNHQGHHLERRLIELKPAKANYYRLRFSAGASPVPLTGVRAYASRQTRVVRSREMQLPVESGAEAGEYRFALPAGMRGRRLRIRLPETNSVAVAGIESYDGKRWRRRQGLTLYRLQQQGMELENEAVSIGGVRDRDWRLVLDQAAAGRPVVTVLWQPHDLSFLASGEAPFTLAWGSARVGPADSPRPDALLSATGLTALAAGVRGEAFRVSGDRVLAPRFDWRQWSLWGVLVAGAALLVWMALRLFRQMNP